MERNTYTAEFLSKDEIKVSQSFELKRIQIFVDCYRVSKQILMINRNLNGQLFSVQFYTTTVFASLFIGLVW